MGNPDDLHIQVTPSQELQEQDRRRCRNSQLTVIPPCSKDRGLSLVMETVREGGPAWNCGVRWGTQKHAQKHVSFYFFATDITARPGDAIVTVDGWLITLMDQPKVGRQGKGSRGRCGGEGRLKYMSCC